MSDKPITRRRFLYSMGASVLAFAGARQGQVRRPAKPYFRWAQLRYPGVWNPNPSGPERFLSELRRRTSIEAAIRKVEVKVGDPKLFDLPFLYIAGRGGFPDLGREAAVWLRRYVEHGGFVLIDDASGIDDSGFARGIEKWLASAFPGERLAPIPSDNAIFQAFYLINSIPGRKVVKPYLTGLAREDLTPVVFCSNDLSGAWDGDPLGGYTYPVTPGGERQREMTFRFGVNLVMYAITGNYKKDQVHIPFILKRRQR